VNAPSSSIRICVLETEEYFLEAFAHDPIRKRMWLIGSAASWFIFGYFVLDSVIARRKGHRHWRLGAAIGFFVSVLMSLWFSPAGQKWQLKRNLHKRLTRPPTQAWFEFREAGFLSAGREGSSSHHPWTLVQRVIEKTAGLLIYIDENAYFWVPKRAFSSPEDFARLVELIITRVKRFDHFRA
jgi:hypothetical protein